MHVQHDSLDERSPLHPSSPGNAFKDGYGPRNGERLVAKSVNSAFIGTDLELRLRRLGVRHVASFGLVTDQCVSTTVRMAANLGYGGFVVGDASAAYGITGPDGVALPPRRSTGRISRRCTTSSRRCTTRTRCSRRSAGPLREPSPASAQ